MSIEIKNGALLGQDKFDWLAGANSPIDRKILLPSGNWKELSIPNEIQVVNYGQDNQYDTSMCVTFNGLTDGLEYILMQMLRLNLIPTVSVKWLQDKGYFDNGVINFNERFPANLGNTTSQGAYQYKVANAAKNSGLIPQKMFPFADNFNDNIDPKFITQAMYDLGKEFLTHFAINYEWVNAEDTKEWLKYSPLSCIGQYADGEGILNPPTSNGHCMLEVNETDDYKEIDDSYWQQFKKYNKAKLQSFMAFYITPLKTNINDMDTLKWIKDNDLKWVQNSVTGQFGRVLRGKLLMFTSNDRGTAALLDDKMRTQPNIKISPAEFEQLERVGMTGNF